jgi:hypothetical protein
VSALPGDIALYTTDGVLLTSPVDPAVSAAIAADNIDAKSSGTSEVIMFFDNASDGQIYLDERFSYQSKVNPAHLGIEIEDILPLGDTIALTPNVPTFTVIDRDINFISTVRTRAYAHDMGTDRFSIEVLA